MRHLSEIICTTRMLTVAPHCSVKEVCARMRDSNAGASVIVDSSGKLLGIFTGRDAVARVLAEGRIPGKTKISSVMTPNPKTMSLGSSSIEALRLMWDGGFRHLPVVENGVVCGLLSRADFQACEADRLEVEQELWEHMR